MSNTVKCGINYWYSLYSFYVKYRITIHIITHVTIIPPNNKYLSPSDLRSMSLITVFDMPNIEATSSIFFWIPLIINLWSRMFCMILCPWLKRSSMPRFDLCNAELCSKARSIRMEVSEAEPLAALAFVVNFVCINSSHSRSNPAGHRFEKTSLKLGSVASLLSLNRTFFQISTSNPR